MNIRKLFQINSEGKTTTMATHSQSLANFAQRMIDLFNRVAVIENQGIDRQVVIELICSENAPSQALERNLKRVVLDV